MPLLTILLTIFFMNCLFVSQSHHILYNYQILIYFSERECIGCQNYLLKGFQYDYIINPIQLHTNTQEIGSDSTIFRNKIFYFIYVVTCHSMSFAGEWLGERVMSGVGWSSPAYTWRYTPVSF